MGDALLWQNFRLIAYLGKKKIMVGKKSPQLFIFICQFLRGFITATKPMLTLELMQQDAKWLQFP